MQPFPTSPGALVRGLWRHRALIAALARREVAGRYRGSVMGILWSLFPPLLMLAVYTFVFGVVFKARWTEAAESRVDFALILFAGLLAFNLFAETVNRAPTLVVANPNYVKKVVFPLEILPVVALGAALFHTAVGLLVWLAFYLALMGGPTPTMLLLPVVLLPLALLTLGVSWVLASLGVFLRDVAPLIVVATTALLFFSPVFYPLASLPAEYRQLLALNPLTPLIEQTRDVLVWGRAPGAGVLALEIAAALVVAWLGFAWFQRSRRDFADVL